VSTNGEDDGYSRLPLDQLVETLAAQAKALGLHIDLSYKFHHPGRFGGVKDPKLIEGVVAQSSEPELLSERGVGPRRRRRL
jgi:hypothetical protein